MTGERQKEGTNWVLWGACTAATGLYLIYPWLHAHEWVLILIFIVLVGILVVMNGSGT